MLSLSSSYSRMRERSWVSSTSMFFSKGPPRPACPCPRGTMISRTSRVSRGAAHRELLASIAPSLRLELSRAFISCRVSFSSFLEKSIGVKRFKGPRTLSSQMNGRKKRSNRTVPALARRHSICRSCLEAHNTRRRRKWRGSTAGWPGFPRPGSCQRPGVRRLRSLGRRGGIEKAREGDADWMADRKSGLASSFGLFWPLVALLRQLPDFGRVERDEGHFGAGEEGVD